MQSEEVVAVDENGSEYNKYSVTNNTFTVKQLVYSLLTLVLMALMAKRTEGLHITNLTPVLIGSYRWHILSQFLPVQRTQSSG